eukprot:269498-Rhodomonas_salina.3
MRDAVERAHPGGGSARAHGGVAADDREEPAVLVVHNARGQYRRWRRRYCRNSIGKYHRRAGGLVGVGELGPVLAAPERLEEEAHEGEPDAVDVVLGPLLLVDELLRRRVARVAWRCAVVVPRHPLRRTQ